MKITQNRGGCLTILVILVFQSAELKAQALQYDYDQAGNRILKELVNRDGEGEVFEPEQFRKKTAELAMKSQEQSEIRVYPNPIRGNFAFLELSNVLEENASLDLYNQNGLKVKHWENLSSQNKLDLSSIASGTYLLRYTSPKETKVFHLVKN